MRHNVLQPIGTYFFHSKMTNDCLAIEVIITQEFCLCATEKGPLYVAALKWDDHNA